jgi:hypothetical protein
MTRSNGEVLEDLEIGNRGITDHLDLKNELFICNGTFRDSLPDWTASLIWFGMECRRIQIEKKRLVTFLVLPTREFAAAFISLGGLISGCRLFENELSWPKFRKLAAETTIYWIKADKVHEGLIAGFEEICGEDFIRIDQVKPKSKFQVSLSVSRANFENYRFSLEKPLSVKKDSSFSDAQSFLSAAAGTVHPAWIFSDGAECLLVTNMIRFNREVSEISLVSGQSPQMDLAEILCLDRVNQLHAKLRISHPRGKLLGRYPLVILDGPGAFDGYHHVDNMANVIVILNRVEYRELIHNEVMQLRNSEDEAPKDLFGDLSFRLPVGFECASYLVRSNE